MNINSKYRYTKEHEWAELADGLVRVGVSDHAQHELGDVVFVDLPKVGAVCKAGESFLTVESVKAVSDVYAPVSGKVSEVNSLLGTNPEKINKSPYAEGWIALIEPVDISEIERLMSAEQYGAYLTQISK